MKEKQSQKSKLSKAEKKQLKAWEEDVPTVASHKSIEEREREDGHGFWGNSTTGYIYDKDTKEEKRYKNR